MSSPHPILTVSQLTQAIKLSLESTFPSVCLQGEISNFKLQSSGHLYFSLKDENAQIAAIMFRADAISLRVPPKGGDKVIVKGDINVYPSKGNYQLIVRELSYVGIGELLQKLEQLKIKLHQLGWFKSARKKPLPRYPKRIGVVTSPTGAVIQDIINILSRRFSGFNLILNPVKVQGEGAAIEIARAIKHMNQYNLCDVMIVGRGGGSLEDLWPFNEEIVAEAIYNSKIPIISAVGHETDHCIADYVADVRAPTPSAAAEIVMAEKNQQLDYLANIKRRMQQTLMHLVQKDKVKLTGLLKHPLFLRPQVILEPFMLKLDDVRSDIQLGFNQFLQLKKTQLSICAKQAFALKPTNQILHFKQKVSYWTRSLSQSWVSQQIRRRQQFNSNRFSKNIDQLLLQQIQNKRERLNNLIQTFDALNPQNVLNKGYSILFSEKDASVITSVQQITPGFSGKLLLADGEALITIKEVIHRDY